MDIQSGGAEFLCPLIVCGFLPILWMPGSIIGVALQPSAINPISLLCMACFKYLCFSLCSTFCACVCVQVRLVVVDSIASHFRHDFDDMGLRNRILSGLAQNLIKVAVEDNIAVSY